MVKDTKLYDILEVDISATEVEIKKAYRKKALKHHPDKNNHSPESIKLFQEISHAYETLSNATKRGLYDQYGTTDEGEIGEMLAKQNFNNSGGSTHGNLFSAHSAGDLFAQFFGGRGPNVASASGFGFMSGMSNDPFQSFSHDFSTTAASNSDFHEMVSGPGIRHNLKCNSYDLFHGKRAKLALNRTRLCQGCQGFGGKKTTQCMGCQGTGVFTTTKRMGPMVQTWQTSCKDCGGTGKYIRSKDACQECSGNGFLKERKIFDVEVVPGMRNGNEIILPGEADEVINTEYGKERVIPGDVIITIQLNRKEDKMKYKYLIHDHDLILDNFEVDLKTSLCGGTIVVEDHPSGTPFKIEVLSGELLKPGCIKCVENKGMPIDPNGKYGNLYIRFQVKFPESLGADTIDKLSEILVDDKNHGIDPATISEEQVLSTFTDDDLHSKFQDAKTNQSNKRKRTDDGIFQHNTDSNYSQQPSDSCNVN
ncbi:unnamed protein product [Kluyveromyces dobzhanskii CBS 2104]|uniref:WGS project CCBQ000000000 data, contig 00017 n=1 Tax=Kluyveromyces dobzhanskii CBS 2104 TaxID=1427455 RepID=A0A0A8L648_9SACH|nr:unnamed protein product [Kluyveromyces dobzhanskii CBS 2104]